MVESRTRGARRSTRSRPRGLPSVEEAGHAERQFGRLRRSGTRPHVPIAISRCRGPCIFRTVVGAGAERLRAGFLVARTRPRLRRASERLATLRCAQGAATFGSARPHALGERGGSPARAQCPRGRFCGIRSSRSAVSADAHGASPIPNVAAPSRRNAVSRAAPEALRSRAVSELRESPRGDAPRPHRTTVRKNARASAAAISRSERAARTASSKTGDCLSGMTRFFDGAGALVGGYAWRRRAPRVRPRRPSTASSRRAAMTRSEAGKISAA